MKLAIFPGMNLPVITWLAIAWVLLPSVVGVFFVRRLDAGSRLLYGLFCFHAILTLVQLVMALQKINNLWTSHIYYVIEVAVVFRAYSHWVFETSVQRTLLGLTIGYAVFWFAAKFFFESFTTTALYTPTVSRVLLIGATLYTLMVLASTGELPLVRSPRFWFASGFLTLSTVSLMFYGFRTLMYQFPMETFSAILNIHLANNILSNSLFIIGFLCMLRLPNTGGPLELAR